MTGERKFLLLIPEFLILGLIGLTAGKSLDGENSLLRDKIQQIKEEDERQRGEINTLPVHPNINREIRNEVISLFQRFARDPDLYRAGQILNREWGNRGLTLIEYGERKNDDTPFLEYSLSGDPSAFLAFLEDPAFPVKIYYLTIDSRSHPSRFCLGIGPAGLPANITAPPGLGEEAPAPPARQIPPSELAALFPRMDPPVEKILPDPGQTIPVMEGKSERVSPIKDRMTYIGRVATGEKGIVYGFKESASGQIILVSSLGTANEKGWFLYGESLTGFLLIHEDIPYEVKK